jgi:hypothetical protein
MGRTIFSLVRLEHPQWWLGLCLFLAAFGLLRVLSERSRRHDETELAKSAALNRLLWQEYGVSTKRVQASPLAGGRPLDLRPAEFDSRTATVSGDGIGPAFRGWTIILRFYRGTLDGFNNESLFGGRIVPPPGVVLRREPTTAWWAVESARIVLMFAGIVAWSAGLTLMIVVGGIRRQMASFCLASAIICLFSAALAWNFHWETATQRELWWFRAGEIMAIIALVLRLLPGRRVDAGQCRKCHYDLTGNVSGICPECGTPTPRHIRQMRRAELTPAAERLVQIEAEVPEEGAADPGNADVLVASAVLRLADEDSGIAGSPMLEFADGDVGNGQLITTNQITPGAFAVGNQSIFVGGLPNTVINGSPVSAPNDLEVAAYSLPTYVLPL